VREGEGTDGSPLPHRTHPLISPLVVGLAGFVVLAIGYEREPLATLDVEVAESVATSLPGWAQVLARPFSWLGGWIGITALTAAAVVLLARERNWLDVGFVLVAVVGSQIAVAILKAWFDRPRPDVGAALELPTSASFPSGHATSGIAALGAFTVLASERLATRRARVWLWAAAVVVGLAVGLSRIALNVHYVTDVLAGWCFGLAWLAACLLVRDRLSSRPSL
jgi:undecaprenyl-diphosphatase